MTIQTDVLLSDYTTFRFGGPAKYFVEVSDEEELKSILGKAESEKERVLILAGGSNMIISSKGFDGYVIRPQFVDIQIVGNKLIVGSGGVVSDVLEAAIEHGLGGLEWAGGLPGTIGGAVRGNAGAFGGEIKDIVFEVRSFSSHLKKVIIRDNNECRFEYRGSYYKDHPEEVITEITLVLHPSDPAALRAVADSRVKYRKERHPIEFGCAGSIFKNVPCQKLSKQTLALFEDVVKDDPFPVVPAAKVIADCGLAGRTIGDAQVSTKHTNYIINLKRATGEDVVALSKTVKDEVKEKFGIDLEIEPQLVGFGD